MWVLHERNVAKIFEYIFYLKIFWSHKQDLGGAISNIAYKKRCVYVYCGILKVGISGLAGWYFLLSSITGLWWGIICCQCLETKKRLIALVTLYIFTFYFNDDQWYLHNYIYFRKPRLYVTRNVGISLFVSKGWVGTLESDLSVFQALPYHMLAVWPWFS